MNWNNLKNYKCPKCNHILTRGGDFHHCHGTKCGFVISNTKFENIVNSTYQSARKHGEESKLSELNNLGRKKVSEDFSDNQPDL